MKVSVLIETYNCEDQIYTAIRSVLKQTCDELEIIIIDKGSNDNTLSRVKQYKLHYPKIVEIIQASEIDDYVINKSLIDRLNGEYVFVMEGSDWISPTTFEEMMFNAKKHDSDLVLCGNEIQRLTDSLKKKQILNKREVLNTFLKDSKLIQNIKGKLISRKKLDDVVTSSKCDSEYLLISEIMMNTNKVVTLPFILYHPSKSTSVDEFSDKNGMNNLENHVKVIRDILEMDPTLKNMARRNLTVFKIKMILSRIQLCKLDKNSFKTICELKLD